MGDDNNTHGFTQDDNGVWPDSSNTPTNSTGDPGKDFDGLTWKQIEAAILGGGSMAPGQDQADQAYGNVNWQSLQAAARRVPDDAAEPRRRRGGRPEAGRGARRGRRPVEGHGGDQLQGHDERHGLEVPRPRPPDQRRQQRRPQHPEPAGQLGRVPAVGAEHLALHRLLLRPAGHRARQGAQRRARVHLAVPRRRRDDDERHAPGRQPAVRQVPLVLRRQLHRAAAA